MYFQKAFKLDEETLSEGEFHVLFFKMPDILLAFFVS